MTSGFGWAVWAVWGRGGATCDGTVGAREGDHWPVDLGGGGGGGEGGAIVNIQ